MVRMALLAVIALAATAVLQWISDKAIWWNIPGYRSAGKRIGLRYRGVMHEKGGLTYHRSCDRMLCVGISARDDMPWQDMRGTDRICRKGEAMIYCPFCERIVDTLSRNGTPRDSRSDRGPMGIVR